MLVARIHNAPAEKGTRAIHRNAFVNVRHAATALIVNMRKRSANADARRSNRTLHGHFDNVQRIENRTDNRTDQSASKELLHRLRDGIALRKKSTNT